MKSRLVSVLLVLIAIMAVTVAMAQTTEPPSGDYDDPREDVVRNVLDADGNVVNSDEKLARIAKEQAGGFGGFYFHETDESIAYVFMKDVTETTAAAAAFNAAYDGDRPITQIIAVQGDYAFDDLLKWYGILDTALVQAEIHPTSGAVMEIRNRIVFGVQSADQITRAKQVVLDNAVPAGAVVFEERPIILLSKGALDEEWRPLVGGIQHQQEEYGVKCTIGFGTERDNEEGLVLASHCTNEEGYVGGVDDAVIHQPVNPVVGSKVVATETIDPRLTAMNHEQCEEKYYCRYSDAAYAELDEDEDLDLGKIAKPTSIGSTDVNPEGTTFSITREGSVRVGDTLYYVGRTTGWGTARVTDTCAFSTLKSAFGGGTGVRIVCVIEAQATSDDHPEKGDSGAPVFDPISGNNVELVGTLFSGARTFYTSKVGLIYYELDSSATWDSCTSGC